jgi:hypothetical protein
VCSLLRVALKNSSAAKAALGGLPQDDDSGGRHRQRRGCAGRTGYHQFSGLCPLGHLLDDNEQDCIRSAQSAANAVALV